MNLNGLSRCGVVRKCLQVFDFQFFMKKISPLFALLFAAVTLFSQKEISLEDCFVLYKFYPQGSKGFRYMNDGRHFSEMQGNGLRVYDVLRPEVDSSADSFIQFAAKGADFDDYFFSKDESKIVFRSNVEPVYRHSVLANYSVYDLKSKQLTAINPSAKQQFATLSPDGLKMAFVADNNLYVKDLRSEKVEQVTRDGAKNRVINGLPDWVYEEEFSPVAGDGMVATVWSPDSRRVAFLRFDESQVRSFPLTFYRGEAYPKYTEFKYPKVGELNSDVSVHIFDLETGKTASPQVKNAPDDYLVRLNWTPANQLVVTRLNRLQSQLDLVQIDPATANFKILLSENDPAYVEVHDDLKFLQEGKTFVWTSEKSGFNHAYLYNMEGKEVRTLTAGEFDVTDFYGVDELNREFFYQTATPTPLDRQVWRGFLDGRPPKLLTPERGWHEADFSPTFEYFSLKKSDANTPPSVDLCQRTGEVVRNLVKNDRVAKLRQEFGFAEKTFWTFKTGDGTELNGWMLRPKDLVAGKKYPVLFDNYGGPGSQTVENQYDGYMNSWHQMLVKKGVIVVSLDNRGTGARGRDFKKCTQLQLGKFETEDQIAAARHLATLDFVDGARIGIWGWSFGGYLSTSCLLKGNTVFKMAMAVAPVVNWKWYDSAYTERYMHTGTDNEKGYEDNSPVNFAKNLRGKYLLCHGVADDNVHWQQAVEMTDALIAANQQFETYYYPNRNHGIYGENATMHLFRKLTDFVLKNL